MTNFNISYAFSSKIIFKKFVFNLNAVLSQDGYPMRVKIIQKRPKYVLDSITKPNLFVRSETVKDLRNLSFV